METTTNGVTTGTSNAKLDEERMKNTKRAALKALNAEKVVQESAKLDSSMKRHTTLIKRMKLSLAADNRDQTLKDIDSLSLEKYVDEIAGAAVEGIARCKTEKDVWCAVEVISAMHRRFPNTFTPALVPLLSTVMAAPSRAALNALTQEQREKEDSTRISRQRPVLRVCSELALVGIIGPEWIIKVIKELLSNDPSLSSLPLLSLFLRSYGFPFLGIVPPSTKTQIPQGTEPGTLSEQSGQDAYPALDTADNNLVDQDIKDRFKKMCEGYFESVSKKLVIEHKRLQEQDRRNHEAYIRSGEIFEDRQQAYEKMTKSYEKILSSCQILSELLYLPLPNLPTASTESSSVVIGTGQNSLFASSGADDEDILASGGGKWVDEEERKFYEEVQDLKDFVPRSVLGIDDQDDKDRAGQSTSGDKDKDKSKESDEEAQKEDEKDQVRKLEEELEKLSVENAQLPAVNGSGDVQHDDADMEESVPTPTPGTPRASSPPLSPQLAPQGPGQLLTGLLARLPDCTNRALIDQAAVDFAFLNSKAARKRLVKFLMQVPKNRTDLLPYYARLVATLSKYMPDVGTELVSALDEEFRYLQRKKKVVVELAEARMKNVMFLSALSKFSVVPSHVILHMYKVCIDDFNGVNVEMIALLLENCGRFLLRNDETKERFGTMLKLIRRKQTLQHLDPRQELLLENAYYQCNPPERAPRQTKERTPMELFIHHLIHDVLSKKTIDKVLKLLRKLDWQSQPTITILHKLFTKPWKLKYSNISLMAMLVYDLQRYHPEFAVGIVDQVLEDLRLGLERNVYGWNQRRLAGIKFLGELYIYRLMSSGIIFDTLWSLVTFGHLDGRPLPHEHCPLDMPDDFFRVRLICVLLDTCGMCFDRGSQKKKLDNFLIYFQYYTHCKTDMPMDVDFMVSDSLEAVRPKFQICKTIEEAAVAVDDMLNSAFQMETVSGGDAGEDSGDESGGEGDENERHIEADREDEDDGDTASPVSPINERAPSPEPEVVLSTSNSQQENLGPTEEADAEFNKELAKLVTDTSSESRKVDKKTALAMWDSTVLPPALLKKRNDESEDNDVNDKGAAIMNFTVVTKRGNKPQTRQLAVPASSALAVHTRSAQMQDKVEQQQLKRLVLNYEQREEAEEMKALEARNRAGAIKIRYVG